MASLVKLSLEFGPLAVFFIANYAAGIFVATAAFMIATALALAIGYLRSRRIPAMPLITGVFVLAFGGLTLYLADETFIKLKPTLANGLFALILFSGLALKKPFLKLALGAALPPIDEEGWRKLTVRWAFFFVSLAFLNELVWRSVSTDLWVSFKVFGILPISMIFAVLQAPVILRHQIKSEEA